MSELMSVELTRADLVALRETIELTPGFEGRVQAREAIRGVLRERRPTLLRIDEAVLAAVAQRIVPIDVTTASLRSKLDRALRSGRASGPTASSNPQVVNA
jgi:hypothetical protein